jgi:plasmid segregation protein ParM
MVGVMAVDLGYSAVKVAAQGELFSFPSAVAVKPETGSIAGELESYSLEGVSYLVGKEAMLFSPNAVGGKSADVSVAYGPLFVAKAVNEARKRLGKEYKPAVLVVSVAVNEFNKEITVPLPEGGELTGRKAELLEERLKRFTVNGEEFAFDEVVVLPQGRGIWVDAGKPEDALIVDIGFNTTDILRVQEGRIIYATGVNVGVMNLANYLKDILASKGVEITTEKAEKAVREGKVRIKGEYVPLKEIVPIETLKNLLIGRVFGIIEENRNLADALTELGEIIVAGGGGYYVPETYKGYRIVVPEKPEYSNVRGFLKLVEEE